MAVESKGPTKAVVEWVVGKLNRYGYRGVHITLKTDGGPAIVALKEAIAVMRVAETALMESPVRESQGNGKMERAIRTWRSQFKTLRHFLESMLGCAVETNSIIVEWLIVWAGEALNRYKVHPNGKTSFEMAMKHRFKPQIVGFAEQVMFKMNLSKSDTDSSKSDF